PRFLREPFGALLQRGHGRGDRLRGAHVLGTDIAEHAQRLLDRLPAATLCARLPDDPGERVARLRRGLADERGSAALLFRGFLDGGPEIADARDLLGDLLARPVLLAGRVANRVDCAVDVSEGDAETVEVRRLTRSRLRDLARAIRGGRAPLENALQHLGR